MTWWPQISVATWLVAAILGGLARALRKPPGWLVMTTKQQRIVGLIFSATALSEASLLWAGGFFKGML